MKLLDEEKKEKEWKEWETIINRRKETKSERKKERKNHDTNENAAKMTIKTNEVEPENFFPIKLRLVCHRKCQDNEKKLMTTFQAENIENN